MHLCILQMLFVFMHSLEHEVFYCLSYGKNVMYARYAIKDIISYGDTNIDKHNHKLKRAGGSEAIS